MHPDQAANGGVEANDGLKGKKDNKQRPAAGAFFEAQAYAHQCDAQGDSSLLVDETSDEILQPYSAGAWCVKPFRPPGSPESSMLRPQSPNPNDIQAQPEMTTWLRECGVDLMLYAWPHRLSFETEIPYVMAIHDVQHRLQPEFEEVSAGGEWERREYLFQNGARHATLLIADSETGKEDILDCYGEFGVSPDQVKVLPFIPALTIDSEGARRHRERVARQFKLPARYLFYPAQFWPHKNHLRIIEALGELRRDGLEIPLVLSGSATGDLRESTHRQLLDRAAALGIQDQLISLGYVTDDDVTGLYAGAQALVMPTFFGPTNIPVLEAWSLKCPVLTSDIRGIREQAGDAAVIVDPQSVHAIAEGIRSLWLNGLLRQELIDKGKRRLSLYGRDDHDRRLVEIVQEAKNRLRDPLRDVVARG